MSTERPTGLHHVGVPVASMERSLAFYRDLLGVEPDFVAPGSGEELSRAVGVPDTVLSFAFLRLGNTILELLEYEHPRGRPYDRRNCDIGAVHVCFEVDDIHATCEALRAQGGRAQLAAGRDRRGAAGGVLVRVLQGSRRGAAGAVRGGGEALGRLAPPRSSRRCARRRGAVSPGGLPRWLRLLLRDRRS